MRANGIFLSVEKRVSGHVSRSFVPFAVAAFHASQHPPLSPSRSTVPLLVTLGTSTGRVEPSAGVELDRVFDVVLIVVQESAR